MHAAPQSATRHSWGRRAASRAGARKRTRSSNTPQRIALPLASSAGTPTAPGWTQWLDTPRTGGAKSPAQHRNGGSRPARSTCEPPREASCCRLGRLATQPIGPQAKPLVVLGRPLVNLAVASPGSHPSLQSRHSSGPGGAPGGAPAAWMPTGHSESPRLHGSTGLQSPWRSQAPRALPAQSPTAPCRSRHRAHGSGPNALPQPTWPPLPKEVPHGDRRHGVHICTPMHLNKMLTAPTRSRRGAKPQYAGGRIGSAQTGQDGRSRVADRKPASR